MWRRERDSLLLPVTAPEAAKSPAATAKPEIQLSH